MSHSRTLFAFWPLAEFLDRLGFPKVEHSGFQIVRRDLSREEQEGRVRYEAGSVQLDIGGAEYKGYIYLKNPRDIERFGLPKFHIGMCEKLEDERARGKFDNRYFWSNSPTVDLVDGLTKREYKKADLSLCGFCRKALKAGIEPTTTGFTKALDIHEQDVVSDEVVLDLFGYPTDWQKISKALREERNHTCECCGLHVIPELRRRGMLQVHHINGNKTDNRRANLLCLCVYCHARIDEHHEVNFKATSRMLRQLQSFMKLLPDGVEVLPHTRCRRALLNQYQAGRIE